MFMMSTKKDKQTALVQVYYSALSIMVAHRGTGWLRSPYRRVQRVRRWCLSVRELGAAPPHRNQPSVVSAASGLSTRWDARASPRACSSASGQCNYKLHQFDDTSLKKKLNIINPFFVEQEQLHIWFIPEQRWDCILWPHSWWKTLCYTLFQHFSVFGL